MTGVLVRDGNGTVAVTDLVDAVTPTPPPSVVVGASLAALAAAAGVIHLVMVPAHHAEWAPEGVAFAIAGWGQLALAAALLRRTSGPLLRVTAWINAALVLAWVVSRTRGLPVGPDAGVREAIGAVDGTCVAIEVALVVAALVFAARKGLVGRALRRVATVGAVVAVVGATVAIATPGARNHAHSHTDSAVDTALGLGMLHNGHHDTITVEPLGPATRAALDDELALTREVAARYPTLASAYAAGYRRAGPYSPGLGLHVTHVSAAALNVDGRMDRGDLLDPMSIIYDGTAPDSRVAGFMYYSASATRPEGFAGPNDHWHYHTNVCIARGAENDGSTDAPLGADRSTTKAACDRAGGFLLPKTQWMVHVWSVPGYEVADAQGGVFGEVNPDLRCSDGTYFEMPASEWASHPTNVCRSALDVSR
jgi:hypothetical protein